MKTEHLVLFIEYSIFSNEMSRGRAFRLSLALTYLPIN